jgi:GAF domain-containing protein
VVEEVAKPPPPPRRPIGRSPHELKREELLAELFLRAPHVREKHTPADGLGYLLDLAMEKVHCEAGSVFLAANEGQLTFAVARGPKAADILKLAPKIPMGAGVVGFCVQEAVAVAVSDAEKDPRFHKAISEAVRYPTRSILCAPLTQAGRVFGAIELMNKQEGAFDEGDLAVLSYLAHQAAAFLAAKEAEQPL